MIQKRDRFYSNQFTLGLVIRASIETIDDIKRYIGEHGDVTIVYTTLSTGKLWIKEGGDSDGK